MADQINMAGLSLADQQPPQGQGQRSYIPPHMRGKMHNNAMGPGPGPAPGPGPSPAAMNGLNNSAWAG